MQETEAPNIQPDSTAGDSVIKYIKENYNKNITTSFWRDHVTALL